MAVEIKVPMLGESISEGTLSRWLKKDGDWVRADEPIFELETEKATSEIPAPASGTLKTVVTEGQTVAVGSVVGRIDESAAAAPRSVASTGAERKCADTASAGPVNTSADGGTGVEKETVASPAARRLAEERGVDVRQVSGTGREQRITKEDVINYLAGETSSNRSPQAITAPDTRTDGNPATALTPKSKPAPSLAVSTEGGETRQRMTGIRMRIAERLVASQQNTATLTTFNEADLTAVMSLRNLYKESFRQRHGVGLGFTSFFVKAVVEALQTYPIVNARVDGSDIVFHHFYHIGVAVSTDRGLMVPVLRDADRLSFVEIEKQVAAMAEKARDGKISVSDLQGGTFTITNGGVFGSLVSTPILNPPQSAILGMHAIQKRPVVIDDQIVIRPMMYLALSYDHRLIDGRDAVLFLVRVKECIEHPERLLLEV
jgi:2-oxoglutarate dehydrogenase E2 component (dihydrolipoamide succinyltransferase)